MAVIRTQAVCSFCQARRAPTGRQHPNPPSKRRRVATLAVTPVVDSVELKMGAFAQASHNALSVLHSDISPSQIFLPSEPLPLDAAANLREATESLESLMDLKEFRANVLARLSNPVQEKPQAVKLPSKSPSLFTTGPVPHEIFRARIRAARLGSPISNDKLIRRMLRTQLLYCEWPRDVYRIFAVAMQKKDIAAKLAIHEEPIMRAIYRCRTNVDDSTVLTLVSVVIARFKYAGYLVSQDLLLLGLKFAARTRSLLGMKKYLRLLRERGISVSSVKFRAIIAKCSIGKRGLGEIRNGRWNRSELLQVLLGFDDCQNLPSDEQFHLETFMNRKDWQYLHGWIAILSRCKDVKTLWHEWQLWKTSDARRNPKQLATIHRLMNSRVRGDHWFVEQFAMAGASKEAWQIKEEVGIEFSNLNERTQMAMLDGLDFATLCDEGIRQGLLHKCDIELQKMEAALGVTWIPAGKNDKSEGVHRPIEDQEDVLEKLAAPDWKLDHDFGYPYQDKSDVERSREKALQQAEERGLAAAV